MSTMSSVEDCGEEVKQDSACFAISISSWQVERGDDGQSLPPLKEIAMASSLRHITLYQYS